MSTASLQRASVFAVKEEVTSGTLIWPTVGTDFVPLRPGFSVTPSLEEIVNEELLNDIAKAKSYTGKEMVEGTHNAYFKSKGIPGFPNWDILLRSSLGGSSSRTSTDLVLATSTTILIKVTSVVGYVVGQAIMINGEIRNIQAIDTIGNSLTPNFAFTAINTNDVIQKCYCISPVATGHPTYSTFYYTASGTSIEAASGCRTKSVTMNFEASKQAEINFSYEGVKYYFNPIKIIATNKYIDAVDFNSDTIAAVLTEKTYRSPDELADEIATRLSLASGETFTCTFASSGANAGKFTIADAAGVYSLLCNTGVNVANAVWSTIGMSTTADKTLAATYTSDTAIAYAVPYTPTFDAADTIIMKGAQLFLGNQTENFCRKASKVSVTIDTPVTDVESICSETGVLEKLILSREVKLTATMILEKHDVALFTKMINASSTQAMVNFGLITSSLFTVGKSINVYIGNFVITSHKIEGDDIAVVSIEGKGFVSSAATKDIYVNFV